MRGIAPAVQPTISAESSSFGSLSPCSYSRLCFGSEHACGERDLAPLRAAVRLKMLLSSTEERDDTMLPLTLSDAENCKSVFE
jgi:hypothetical protein